MRRVMSATTLSEPLCWMASAIFCMAAMTPSGAARTLAVIASVMPCAKAFRQAAAQLHPSGRFCPGTFFFFHSAAVSSTASLIGFGAKRNRTRTLFAPSQWSCHGWPAVCQPLGHGQEALDAAEDVWSDDWPWLVRRSISALLSTPTRLSWQSCVSSRLSSFGRRFDVCFFFFFCGAVSAAQCVAYEQWVIWSSEGETKTAFRG